jgi:hypothetical protein
LFVVRFFFAPSQALLASCPGVHAWKSESHEFDEGFQMVISVGSHFGRQIDATLWALQKIDLFEA